MLLVVGCDGSGRSRATVKDEIELTAAQPVAVVEFEGILVLAVPGDDIVAGFGRLHPGNSEELERASLGRILDEAWIEDSWVSYPVYDPPFIPVTGPGSNVVRYRWTLELADGFASGTVPIEAGLSPVYGRGGPGSPGHDTVPTVTLRNVSVTYP